jgi:hypothetical protein
VTYALGLRLRLGLLAIVGFAAFGACATEDYVFVDTEDLPSHCFNGTIDTELGETALNCGGECARCQNGEACLVNSDCVAGMCLDLFCQSANCDNDERDGDESDEDCGGGCRPCDTGQLCNDNDDCISKVCTTEGTCAEASCTDSVTNGTETGIDCGGDRCSACPSNSPCRLPTDCESGLCSDDGICSVSCLDNRGECDGDTSLECETNLLTDPNHCGACGSVCNPLHAVPACISGACTVGSCEAPYDDCDHYANNGCETNLSAEVENCGACGMACLAINGTPRCEGSQCRIDCNAGFGDCNGDARDGCEKAVTSDVNNCNGCGIECPDDGGVTPYCLNGVCGGTVCPEGFGNCNGDPSDECEQDLRTSVESCGSCGNLCVVANGTPACIDGECVVGSCSEGFGNCNAGDEDGGYADGCETNTNVSTSNCGGCGVECSIPNATARCDAGNCEIDTCADGYADCNQDGTSCEVDIRTDKDHCGGCTATPCDDLYPNATGACENRRCEFDQCNGNFANCDDSLNNGCETDLRTSEAHCNACNAECSTAGTDTNTCENGVCTPACEEDFLDCDNDGENGCEVDSTSDAQHCGNCSTRCQTPAGTAANPCVDSVCAPECTAPNQDCDENPANGCESSSNTDEANCGGCGIECGTTNATTTTCTGGACVPSCSPGWGACTNPTAGCTDSLNTPQRCGNCATSCSGANPYCVSGSCGALLVNSGTTADSENGSLSFNHTLATGDNQNRLVLLALVALNSTPANAVPSTVSYAGGAMTAFGTQFGSNGVYTRFYYRLEAALPDSTGVKPVIVTMPSNATKLAAEVLEFKGMHQTTPIEAIVNGGGGENFCNSQLFSSTILVQTKGAYIYSLAALEWGDGREPQAPDPHGGLIQTFKRSEHRNLLPVGGYIAAANAVNYTVGWTAVCSHYTHQVIALRPATALP